MYRQYHACTPGHACTLIKATQHSRDKYNTRTHLYTAVYVHLLAACNQEQLLCVYSILTNHS